MLPQTHAEALRVLLDPRKFIAVGYMKKISIRDAMIILKPQTRAEIGNQPSRVHTARGFTARNTSVAGKSLFTGLKCRMQIPCKYLHIVTDLIYVRV